MTSRNPSKRTRVCTALILCLFMCLSAAGTLAATESDFSYVISSGCATITRYSGEESTLFVPDMLGGYPVTAIESHAFFGCDDLVSIIFPESLKYIGAVAFEFCPSLENVVLPDGLEYLGDSVFSDSPDLNSIHIPGSVKHVNTLGDSSGYFNVKNVTLGYGIESLNGTFEGLSLENEVYLPDSITHISQHTFFGSGAFFTNLPANLVWLDDYALEHGDFGDVTLPENLQYTDTSFFESSMRSLTVPGSYKMIGGFRCSHIEYIYLSEGVEVILDHAFSGIEQLSAVHLPSTLREIGDYAFSYDDISYARPYRGGLKMLTVPEGVQSIGEGAFMGSYLQYISLPASLSYIGKDAFTNCSDNLLLIVPKGSYAEQYAKENNLNHQSISASTASVKSHPTSL